MGWIEDVLKDALSRQVFRSRGERTIIRQNSAILRAINDERRRQGIAPIYIEEGRSDFEPLWKIFQWIIIIFFIIIPLMLVYVWVNL